MIGNGIETYIITELINTSLEVLLQDTACLGDGALVDNLEGCCGEVVWRGSAFGDSSCTPVICQCMRQTTVYKVNKVKSVLDKKNQFGPLRKQSTHLCQGLPVTEIFLAMTSLVTVMMTNMNGRGGTILFSQLQK